MADPTAQARSGQVWPDLAATTQSASEGTVRSSSRVPKQPPTRIGSDRSKSTDSLADFLPKRFVWILTQFCTEQNKNGRFDSESADFFNRCRQYMFCA